MRGRRFQVHYGRDGDGAGYTIRDGGLLAPIVFRSDSKSDVEAEADRLNSEHETIAGEKTMCGGCAGSGRIINPNDGRIERHEICGGEGVRR